MPFSPPRPLDPLTGDLHGARVLVVDDEAIWRTILELDLVQLGYTVLLAADADEAAALAAEESPEVAIIDLMLPEPWDGRTLLRRLREAGHDFPVVFYTAYPVVTEHSPAEGLIGHVTKAADRADLYALLPPALISRRASARGKGQ
jgi:CheY-like chemotaxis protein